MVLKENVRPTVEDSGSMHWQISYGKTKAVSSIFTSESLQRNEDEEPTLEDSMDYLDQCLDKLMPGRYIIKYYSDPKNKSRGYGEVHFNIAGSPQHNSIGNPGYGGIYGNDIAALVEEKVTSKLNEKRLEELEEELAEYRKAMEDPTGTKTALAGVLEKINSIPGSENLYAAIVGGIANLFNRKPVISGGPNAHIDTTHAHLPDLAVQSMFPSDADAIEQDLEAHNQQYAEVLYRLRTHVPNLLEVLTTLADKCEANPAGFNQKLSFINML